MGGSCHDVVIYYCLVIVMFDGFIFILQCIYWNFNLFSIILFYFPVLVFYVSSYIF